MHVNKISYEVTIHKNEALLLDLVENRQIKKLTSWDEKWLE